jgi:hypothetical protein
VYPDAHSVIKAVVADFNYKLAAHISSFRGDHFGVSLAKHMGLISLLTKLLCGQVETWLWDSNSAFTRVLDLPTWYGFMDMTSYGGPGDFWGCVISVKFLGVLLKLVSRNNYHLSSMSAVRCIHRNEAYTDAEI